MSEARRPDRGPLCEHAALAIDERRPVELYLQHGEWGWFTLCNACARRRDTSEANDLVCGPCIDEWAEVTGSDYVRRCQNPKPEFPAE